MIRFLLLHDWMMMMWGELALLLAVPATLFAMAWIAEKRKENDKDDDFDL